MSLEDVIAIEDVEFAFNLLLGRSIEQAGLDHYERNAVRPGWTRKTLRDTIIHSAEYRDLRERVIQFPGFKLFVDPGEPDFGKHIATYGGGYEEHNLRIIRSTLREGDTFVDVGANVGLLSLTARSIVGEGGRVICFEPMASNATLLMRSIIANDFSNVVVYPVALSDSRRVLYLEGSSNGYLLPDGRAERRMTTVVGDAYLDREDRIDFLKMDIEGHEPFALRGIERALRRCKPVVMCEFNPIMLNATSRSDPKAFAGQVFSMTRQVQAIDYDGESIVVENVNGLLDLWAKKNRYFTDQGRIAEGFLHFDLVFRADWT